MQRAIAAEAALAAAVVAGEVDLTAVDNDGEGEQVQAGDIESDDQAEGADGSRVGVGTRRGAPLRTGDDVEVPMSADVHILLAVCIRDKDAGRYTSLQRHFYCSSAGPVSGSFSFLHFAVVMISCLLVNLLLGFYDHAIPRASVKHC